MNITQLLIQSHAPIKELSEEELSALKGVLLEMFKDIYGACQKHNLGVMLSGGSCLGAIRHNGFIPWDDDMDIMLLREDYDKLPSVLQEEYGQKYQCVGPNISAHTDMSFMRIEKPGTTLRCVYDTPEEQKPIFMDVFPLDNLPDNHFVRHINAIIADGLQYIGLCMKYYDHKTCPMVEVLRSFPAGKRKINFRLGIGRICSLFTNYTAVFGKLDRFISRYSGKQTKEIGALCSRRYLSEAYPRESILPICMHKFEDMQEAPIPNDYDRYLRTLYGDYMQLPPVEQRKHAFWTELKL